MNQFSNRGSNEFISCKICGVSKEVDLSTKDREGRSSLGEPEELPGKPHKKPSWWEVVRIKISAFIPPSSQDGK